jgi:glucokinase
MVVSNLRGRLPCRWRWGEQKIKSLAMTLLCGYTVACARGQPNQHSGSNNMNREARAIGIDIGGTKIAIAATDGSGAIHARASFATESQRGFASALPKLIETIHLLLKEAHWESATLCGIGIGCAGPVNPVGGTIHNPYTLPGWDNADIVTPLREVFSAPVILENDADAAAMGEFHFGGGANANPLLMVTLGTGIGGAMLVEGAIYRGVNGEHPEPGHLSVLPGGPDCYCGKPGCWESLASGSAIAAAGKAFGFKDSRDVFASSSTDPNAAEIIQRATDATTSALWTILHSLLPQRIIIGGGIGEAHFDLFATPLRQLIARATQIPKARVEVARARLGNEAGVIGAACLALERKEAC